MRRLRASGVRSDGRRRDGGQRTSVALADAVTGEPVDDAETDLVVVRTRLRPNGELAYELNGAVGALALIGDCASRRRLTNAVLRRNTVMRRFDEGWLHGAAAVVM
jgi:hypothetical protein